MICTYKTEVYIPKQMAILTHARFMYVSIYDNLECMQERGGGGALSPSPLRTRHYNLQCTREYVSREKTHTHANHMSHTSFRCTSTVMRRKIMVNANLLFLIIHNFCDTWVEKSTQRHLYIGLAITVYGRPRANPPPKQGQ